MSKQLIAGIKKAAADDWLSFYDVMTLVSDYAYLDTTRLHTVDQLALRSAEIVSELVKSEAIQIGDLDKERGFLPWNTNPEMSAQRITQLVNKFIQEKRDIYPGDICWLQAVDSEPLN